MMQDQRMQDGSGCEFESEPSKRRKTEAAEEEGEGHSTGRLGGEHGEAAVTGLADDLAKKPGIQKIYKDRGQSVTGSNRLSSEFRAPSEQTGDPGQSRARLPGMGLSKKR